MTFDKNAEFERSEPSRPSSIELVPVSIVLIVI